MAYRGSHPAPKQLRQADVDGQVRAAPPLERWLSPIRKHAVIESRHVAGQTADLAVHLPGVNPIADQHRVDGVDVARLAHPESEVEISRDGERGIEPTQIVERLSSDERHGSQSQAVALERQPST
tara:strand:- start:226 stop:600 length:375 start_codon:yes stop_codon:yes gene_type:complete